MHFQNIWKLEHMPRPAIMAATVSCCWLSPPRRDGTQLGEEMALGKFRFRMYSYKHLDMCWQQKYLPSTQTTVLEAYVVGGRITCSLTIKTFLEVRKWE